ncbi:MAG: PilZ domain-containing protein [Candidatus Omnitrophica bacterium]|nr:PilZ domain-containing protein [Candidatus Omnitrophota bacterium]
MKEAYHGPERRQFLRLEHTSPVNYKVCKQETVSKLFSGYTINVSQNGLLCKIKENVSEGEILWLSFDRATLVICEELEKNVFIYQNGIVGKVVRTKPLSSETFEVGIKFLTREEKNLTNIYPKVHFMPENAES